MPLTYTLVEGYDIYASPGELQGGFKWTSLANGGFSPEVFTPGRFVPGQALQLARNSRLTHTIPQGVRPTAFSDGDKVAMAVSFAIKANSGTSSILQLSNGNTSVFSIILRNGVIQTDSFAGTRTTNAVVQAGTWHRITVELVSLVSADPLGNNVAFACTAISRLDGVIADTAQFAYTVNSRGSVANQVILLAQDAAAEYDDVVVADYSEPSTGPAVTTPNLGDFRISSFAPTSNGSLTQFTPSAGTNVSNINNVPFDDDASYNESTTLGATDLFNSTGTLPFSPLSVLGVSISTRLRKTNANMVFIQAAIKSGGVMAYGANTPTTTSYNNFQHTFTLNPNGNVPWNQASVEGIEFGYRIAP